MHPLWIHLGVVNQALHLSNLEELRRENIITVYLALSDEDRKIISARVLGDQQGRRQALDEAIRKVRSLFRPYKENS